MKKTTLTLTACGLLSGIAFAGDTYYPAPVASAPYTPAVATSVAEDDWFIGGTGGYLLDAEEPMYTAHIGHDIGTWGSWNTAAYLEVGYTEIERTMNANYFGTGIDLLGEIDIIPITLNLKLEKAFTDSLRAYIGAGAGIALLDTTTAASTGTIANPSSTDDSVFYGQVFAGLLYHVSPSFEIYGGARWIYLDGFEANLLRLDGTTVTGLVHNFDDYDDILVELGVRFNF